jgi:hypothetical protein
MLYEIVRSAELDAGDIEAIIGAARAYPLDGIKADDLDKKLGYFQRNIHRMRYQHFRDPGMFIGSGAIEGAIGAIAVQRASNPACTGPPKALPASSPCAASTPAAGGTSYGHPAPPSPPGSGQLSDRPGHSDPQAVTPGKIIPNKPVVHPPASDEQPADRGGRYGRRVNDLTGQTQGEWDIEFYADEKGREPCRAWMEGLSSQKRLALEEAIEIVMAQHGTNVAGTEYGKPLRQGLYMNFGFGGLPPRCAGRPVASRTTPPQSPRRFSCACSLARPDGRSFCC